MGRKKGGGRGGGDVLRFENLLYLPLFFHKSWFVMELKEVFELLLIVLGIREVREYRIQRKNDSQQRKDADNGKNHGSTR